MKNMKKYKKKRKTFYMHVLKCWVVCSTIIDYQHVSALASGVRGPFLKTKQRCLWTQRTGSACQINYSKLADIGAAEWRWRLSWKSNGARWFAVTTCHRCVRVPTACTSASKSHAYIHAAATRNVDCLIIQQQQFPWHFNKGRKAESAVGCVWTCIVLLSTLYWC